MTPYEQAVKAGGELADSVQEILANLKSIRGEIFSTSVAAAFEVRQLVDILARISVECKDKEFVVNLCAAGLDLGASIAAKTAISLTEAEVDEVIKIAEQMHERRMRLMQNIRKGG